MKNINITNALSMFQSDEILSCVSSDDGTYFIYKITIDARQCRYYAIPVDEDGKAEQLAEGGQGSVYKVYCVDVDRQEIDPICHEIFKIINNDNIMQDKEHQAAIRNFRRKGGNTNDHFGFYKVGNKSIQILPYFKGDNLSNAIIYGITRDDNINDYSSIYRDEVEGLNRTDKLPSIDYLKFKEKIAISNDISAQCNLLHHHTVSTGPALAHLDVKPANIMINYCLANKHQYSSSSTSDTTIFRSNLKLILSTRLVDFDTSHTLEDPNVIATRRYCGGTAFFQPLN